MGTLPEDDRIKTEEESGAILGLEDMSIFVIKPESILIIHTEEDKRLYNMVVDSVLHANPRTDFC